MIWLSQNHFFFKSIRYWWSLFQSMWMIFDNRKLMTFDAFWRQQGPNIWKFSNLSKAFYCIPFDLILTTKIKFVNVFYVLGSWVQNGQLFAYNSRTSIKNVCIFEIIKIRVAWYTVTLVWPVRKISYIRHLLSIKCQNSSIS